MSEFNGNELRVRTRRGGGVGRREYDYTYVSEICESVRLGGDAPNLTTRSTGYPKSYFDRRSWGERRVA